MANMLICCNSLTVRTRLDVDLGDELFVLGDEPLHLPPELLELCAQCVAFLLPALVPLTARPRASFSVIAALQWVWFLRRQPEAADSSGAQRMTLLLTWPSNSVPQHFGCCELKLKLPVWHQTPPSGILICCGPGILGIAN